MKNEEYLKIIEETVESALSNGCFVEHNSNFGYLSVDMSNGDAYCFQGDDYEIMLSEYESSWVSDYISLEDYVIYSSQNW